VTGYEAHSATWMTSGVGVSGAADTLSIATNTLCAALAEAGACWGNDDIGRAFFNGDSQAAGFGTVRDAVLSELATMVNLLRATGATLVVSGQQYAIAEQASTIGSYLPAGADAGAVSASDPYQLPSLSAGLVESDPPPGAFMDILRLLESLVGGCQYPDGNMAQLANARDAFTAAAKAVSGVADEVSGHAGTVTANNSGAATEKFASFAAALSSGGDQGGLVWLSQACTELAGALDTLIKEKNATRMQFWLSLDFLAATWAVALAFSFFTAGGSEAAAVAVTETEGVALRELILSVAKTVAKAALGGAFFSGGMDAIGQYTRIHEGLQKGFNFGEFGTAVGEGAIAGAVMGGAGAWVGRAANPVTAKLADWMGATGFKGAAARFGFAGLTGTAGNVAAQLPTGHVNLTQAAEFGFGMAGMESAKEAGSHGGEQLDTAIRLNSWLDAQKGPDGAPADTESATHAAPDPTHGQDPDSSDIAWPTQTDLAAATHPADQPAAGHDPGSDSGHEPLPADHSPSADHSALADHSPPPAEMDPAPATPAEPEPAPPTTDPAPVGHDPTAPGHEPPPAGPDPVPTGHEPPPAGSDPQTGHEPPPAGPDPQTGHEPIPTAPGPERPLDPAPAPIGTTDTGVGTDHTAPPISNTAHDSGAPVPPHDGPTPPGAHPSGHDPRASEPPAPANPHGTTDPPPTVHDTPPAADPAQHGGAVRDALHTELTPSGRPSIKDILNPPHPPDPAPTGHVGNTADPVVPVPVGHDGTPPAGPRPHDTRPEPVPPPPRPAEPPAPPAHRPITVDRTALESGLHQIGFKDTEPAPEVPPAVLRELRPTEPATTPVGSDRPTPDLSRVGDDLRRTLEAPSVDGGKLLAQLHGVHQDPVATQRLRDAYTAATGRDLLTDITNAHRDGRLPFDPEPYVKHLLPGPDATEVHPESPRTARENLHDALDARDGAKASEALTHGFGRDPVALDQLKSAYRARYGVELDEHIKTAFGGPEADYLHYLAGAEHLETPAVSIPEVKDLYNRLENGTFITQSGAEVRIPFGHPEDGCYDRAHRMAKKLTEWGLANQKVFAVRVSPGLRVQAETAAGASPGKPQDVNWGYHVAPVIKVVHGSGNVFDVVLDPSLRRGPLGLDEWLGLMGVTRQDYVRFDIPPDTTGIGIGSVDNLVHGLLHRQLESDTALVYTTPRQTYWPNRDMAGTATTAEKHAADKQANIEWYARVSESRAFGNQVISTVKSYHWYSPTKAIVDQLVDTIKSDPSYRMLLTDARAGIPWSNDTLGNGATASLPRRALILKQVYEQLHRGG
jgi:Glutaminase